MRNYILLAAATLALGCAGGTEPPATATPAAPAATAVPARIADAPVPGEAEIRALIRDVYAVISGPAGEERDWDRMRTMFTTDARLSAIVPRRDSANATPRMARVVMTVDDYVQRSGPMLMRDGFFETELYSEIERYGNVAHVWSTYESRIRSPETEPIDRGINSFQLVHIDGRWLVYSILWNSERAGAGTIPDRYLN